MRNVCDNFKNLTLIFRHRNFRKKVSQPKIYVKFPNGIFDLVIGTTFLLKAYNGGYFLLLVKLGYNVVLLRESKLLKYTHIMFLCYHYLRNPLILLPASKIASNDKK